MLLRFESRTSRNRIAGPLCIATIVWVNSKTEKLSTTQQCRGCSSSWVEAELLSGIVSHGRKFSAHATTVSFLALLLLMLQMSAHYPQDKWVGEVAAPARRWWIAFRVGEPPAQIWCANSDDGEQTRQSRIWHSEERASWHILVIKPTRCTDFSNLFLE